LAEASKSAGRRVKVLSFPERRGKTSVQNRASRAAAGDILVFTDATTEFEPAAVRNLVRSFADPSVGVVGGELRYVNRSVSPAGDGGGFYWRYERFIKKLESRVCSLIGVSGCCYAVRRKLYEDLPEDLISDFVIAQVMFRKGKRTVYEPQAVSFEDTCASFGEEFSMRVRVAVRSLHGLWRMRALLNPLRSGFFSLELFSHKVLRYLIPVLLAACLVVNAALCAQTSRAWLYMLFFGLQLVFYAAVFAGWCLRGKRFVSIPFYFFITNLALMVGFVRFLRGERQVLWKPVRK
jgi:cellulose synthase/poly-beta-1,6-N-acetylglucosamine synthase-like glycosyltransferase